MKKFLLYSLMFAMTMNVSACDSSSNNGDMTLETDNGTDPNTNEENSDTTSKYLVIFASRTGNTQTVAEMIGGNLGCDVVEIVPTTPYDDDYNAMLARSQQEQAAIAQGNYPAINTTIPNLDEYDMVFIGYPIWYGHMATPMQSFLHAQGAELGGKRIALFATSGSSGISTSVAEARALSPNATFTETLHLTSSTMSQMESRVTSWLTQIGAEKTDSNESENSSMAVNIIVGNRTITATMEDNSAGRDFLSRLPLEVTLNDYAGTEKIFYPSPVLDVSNAPKGCNPVAGTITIYAPWGNVAIFYKDWHQDNNLIRIGQIDSDGVDALSGAGDVRVRFERK